MAADMEAMIEEIEVLTAQLNRLDEIAAASRHVGRAQDTPATVIGMDGRRTARPKEPANVGTDDVAAVTELTEWRARHFPITEGWVR